MELLSYKLSKKQEEYKDQLLEKWNNDQKIECSKITPSNGNKGGGKNREIIKENDIYYVVDKCKICKKILPIYLFYKQNNKRSKNPLDVQSGYESCDLTCITCKKQQSEKRGKEEDEIIRHMIKKNNGDLTKDWVKQQYEIQNKRCHITNIPIIFKRGYYNSASVQNNGDGHIHYQKNCVLIMQCLQVQEHGILNLKNAWRKILCIMKKEEELLTDTSSFLNELDTKFSNTPEQNGVNVPTQIYEENIGTCNKLVSKTQKVCGRICVKYKSVCWTHLTKKEKQEINNNPEIKRQVTGIKKKINPKYSDQCAKLHLKRILQDQVERYYASDKRSKKRKNKDNIVKLQPKDIIQKMHEQKGRCYLSNIPFSFNRDDPNYWSLERLDNNQHHTLENTVLICRIMNGATQLTKVIIQEIYNKYNTDQSC